jgi:hypothetical protein
MKQTAVEWLIQELRGTDDKGDFIFQGVINSELIEQAKEMEKEQMLEFGSKVTDRWGLTKVEPQYIEDEYNKYYKSK